MRKCFLSSQKESTSKSITKLGKLTLDLKVSFGFLNVSNLLFIYILFIIYRIRGVGTVYRSLYFLKIRLLCNSSKIYFTQYKIEYEFWTKYYYYKYYKILGNIFWKLKCNQSFKRDEIHLKF